ncbi:uncharacterized protein LODBEIA_P51650 [Lodderomyces beijingensis]|uniref:tRNA (guanine(37)-N1)-methyltransferase n=1 Tax=Lodderomyces beijingensis TaxID=1775926 RepID=A0ABP0ZUY5_9ASCO
MNYKILSKLAKSTRRQTIMSKYHPPVNRNMRELDRAFFNIDIPIMCAKFTKPQYLPQFIKSCQSEIFYLPNVKHIIDKDNMKAVLLREEVKSARDLSPLAQTKLEEYEMKLAPHTVHLDYEFWKSDEILAAILPEHLVQEIPSGFATAGHLAHINLKEEFKPYGALIGQVILDKNPVLKTVVDKKNSISNQFRTFPLELLAGEPNYEVEQHESGCKFKFDFSKVYWNSRLSTEHERLVAKFAPGEVVGDVMAGVGPFALPSGKKGTIVLANDLNPESFKYLQENIAINKVDAFVEAYNLDGRKFIEDAASILDGFASRGPIEKKMVKRAKNGTKSASVETIHVPRFYHHFVMNLPDSAITFLDAFVGLYSKCPQIKSEPGFKLPWVHVHCFEKFENGEGPTVEELSERIRRRICKLIDFELDFEKMEFHQVRMVSPTKPMFCVSFQLPEEVAFRTQSGRV